MADLESLLIFRADLEKSIAQHEALLARVDAEIDRARTLDMSSPPPVPAVPKLIAHVLAELARACRELKPTDRGPRDTPANRKLITAATKAHAMDADLWTLAIRRQLDNVRPRRETWKYLALSTICRPQNMARLLDAPEVAGEDASPAPHGRHPVTGVPYRDAKDREDWQRIFEVKARREAALREHAQ